MRMPFFGLPRLAPPERRVLLTSHPNSSPSPNPCPSWEWRERPEPEFQEVEPSASDAPTSSGWPRCAGFAGTPRRRRRLSVFPNSSRGDSTTLPPGWRRFFVGPGRPTSGRSPRRRPSSSAAGLRPGATGRRGRPNCSAGAASGKLGSPGGGAGEVRGKTSGEAAARKRPRRAAPAPAACPTRTTAA